jgi:ribosomal protein L7Ae-like RNA K-turn-binding protein
MIGLAQKAGKVVSGEDGSARDIKTGKSMLVVIAKDSSGNTKKQFKNMCVHRNIPFIEFGTKEQLGKFVGKDYRAVLSIRDSGFAKSISVLYNEKLSGGE